MERKTRTKYIITNNDDLVNNCGEPGSVLSPLLCNGAA